MYRDHHEAAIAALKAGNIAVANAQNDRAVGLMLLAAKRDPQFAIPIYNLGLLCERKERWPDAESFFSRIALIESSPELKKMAADELARVHLMTSLTSSDEGRRRIAFDVELANLLTKRKDPAVAVDLAGHLAQRNATRWEAPALAGVFNANLERWTESVAAFETAARLAPSERRPELLNVLEIARQHARYQALLSDADLAWDKKEYGRAAKLYAEAWEVNPAVTSVGMQAATGYLLDDQVAPAVECLSRLRETGSDDEAQRSGAMLEKLAPISDRAREAAASPRRESPHDSGANANSLIAAVLNSVVSPEMLLVSRPSADTLQDTTPFIVLNDEELTSTDVAMLSTESVFARFEKFAPPLAPPSVPEGAPGTNISDTGVPSPAAAVPTTQTTKPPASPPSLPNRPDLPDLDPRR